MSGMTTISVSREVHEQLKRLGAKGETFNEIITRLLAFYNQRKEEEKEDE